MFLKLLRLLFLNVLFLFSCNDDNIEPMISGNKSAPFIEIIDYIDSEHVKVFRNWDTMSQDCKNESFSKYHYWGYFLRDMGLIYHFSYDDKARRIADSALNIILENCKYDGRIIPHGVDHKWNRDTFARNMRLLFEAYTYLNNKFYLDIIDNQVSLWFKDVPRKYHNGFYIFPYGIKADNSTDSYDIDPNQNLMLAWLFSELYYCEESVFYKNNMLKDAVYNEVEAALSLQLSTGELSLAESFPLVYDSNYGGYSSGILYNICQLWDNSMWNDALVMMGEWLYSSFPMEHPWNTKEDFPNYVKDRFYASNLLERIPAFYAAGVSEEYVYSWIHFVISKFPESEKLIPFKFYQKKTLPSSFILKDYTKEVGYDWPSIIIHDSKITILWREIAYVRIQDTCYQKFPINVKVENGVLQLDIVSVDGRSFKYSTFCDNKIIKIDILDYMHSFFNKE